MVRDCFLRGTNSDKMQYIYALRLLQHKYRTQDIFRFKQQYKNSFTSRCLCKYCRKFDIFQLRVAVQDNFKISRPTRNNHKKRDIFQFKQQYEITMISRLLRDSYSKCDVFQFTTAVQDNSMTSRPLRDKYWKHEILEYQLSV